MDDAGGKLVSSVHPTILRSKGMSDLVFRCGPSEFDRLQALRNQYVVDFLMSDLSPLPTSDTEIILLSAELLVREDVKSAEISSVG